MGRRLDVGGRGRGRRRGLSRDHLTSIGALTLLVSVLLWWLGRRVARPLSALTSAAAALGAGGHQPIEVASSDPSEIRILGETFNRMADQIQSRTAELEASRIAAQQALDAYLEVLSFVAHELKSPLAGASMQLELIADGYAGEVPAQLAPRIDALRRAVGYGHEVALSFNQLSRAESEGFQARPRVVADFIAEIVRPALAEVEEAAAARGMTVTLQGQGGRVPVEGEYGSWIAFSFTIPNVPPDGLHPVEPPAGAATAEG